MALLDAALDCAAARALTVVAVHIHHGLSPHADAWARFCADLCDACSVSLCERRVIVPRGPRRSVEAEARRARYAALAECALAENAHAVLLAHHQDDQAETVLLQLLRGAGPQGLAAMPEARIDATGLKWLRPLLDIPRAAIDAYVNERRLAWVDDDSNADIRYTRNALRSTVVPALASMGAGYPATVARAAICAMSKGKLNPTIIAPSRVAFQNTRSIKSERLKSGTVHAFLASGTFVAKSTFVSSWYERHVFCAFCRNAVRCWLLLLTVAAVQSV